MYCTQPPKNASGSDSTLYLHVFLTIFLLCTVFIVTSKTTKIADFSCFLASLCTYKIFMAQNVKKNIFIYEYKLLQFPLFSPFNTLDAQKRSFSLFFDCKTSFTILSLLKMFHFVPNCPGRYLGLKW